MPLTQNTGAARLIAAIEERVRAEMDSWPYPGHDFAHVARVRALALRLADATDEPVDRLILEAAALLHDVGRDHERRDKSVCHAAQSADMAAQWLGELEFPSEKIEPVCAAIRAHRFRKRMAPETLEGKLLQDADRVDACGAVGLAKAFAYGGAHGRPLYDPEDPFADRRELDDKAFSLDHIPCKLLRLIDTLHTESARRFVQARNAYMLGFLEQLRGELAGEM